MLNKSLYILYAKTIVFWAVALGLLLLINNSAVAVLSLLLLLSPAYGKRRGPLLLFLFLSYTEQRDA